MTKREYRNYSYFFFIFSIVYTGFIINAILTQTGLNRIISVSMFGFLVVMQIRTAFLMRRKFRELDLK